MVWDEHASNTIPLVERIDYYSEYRRLLMLLAAKHSASAAELIRKWNDRCFGLEAEAFMARRLGLR